MKSSKRKLRLNDVIRLPDGRIGTITYRNLDGYGGVWGERKFMPKDHTANLPKPEFILREKSIEDNIRYWWNHSPQMECVGTKCKLIKRENGDISKMSAIKINFLLNKIQRYFKKTQLKQAELGEAKATMIVNFGENGRVLKGIVTGTEPLTKMIEKVFNATQGKL